MTRLAILVLLLTFANFSSAFFLFRGNSAMGLNNYNRGLSSWLMSSLGGFGGSEAGDAGDIIEQQQANQRRFNSFGGGGSFGNFWGGRGSGGYRGFNSPYFLNPYGFSLFDA
uniref:Uncharacterized protein n=1 Tax=Magallana gigas TaxID=29159 RepID=A0A8W8I2X2_MAGGI|nr:uncharacterized protein LOC105347676 isoform X1 [Crassostrea gigas]